MGFCINFRTVLHRIAARAGVMAARAGTQPHVREPWSHVREMRNFEVLVLPKRHVQGITAARAGGFAARAGLTAARAAHVGKNGLLCFACWTLGYF